MRAAVLVLLYERAGAGGPSCGGLRVLLTTRSKELRSHPGQTALPGGKVDQSDAGVVETAVSTLILLLWVFYNTIYWYYSSGKRTRK